MGMALWGMRPNPPGGGPLIPTTETHCKFLCIGILKRKVHLIGFPDFIQPLVTPSKMPNFLKNGVGLLGANPMPRQCQPGNERAPQTAAHRGHKTFCATQVDTFGTVGIAGGHVLAVLCAHIEIAHHRSMQLQGSLGLVLLGKAFRHSPPCGMTRDVSLTPASTPGRS